MTLLHRGFLNVKSIPQECRIEMHLGKGNYVCAILWHGEGLPDSENSIIAPLVYRRQKPLSKWGEWQYSEASLTITRAGVYQLSAKIADGYENVQVVKLGSHQ